MKRPHTHPSIKHPETDMSDLLHRCRAVYQRAIAIRNLFKTLLDIGVWWVECTPLTHLRIHSHPKWIHSSLLSIVGQLITHSPIMMIVLLTSWDALASTFLYWGDVDGQRNCLFGNENWFLNDSGNSLQLHEMKGKTYISSTDIKKQRNIKKWESKKCLQGGDLHGSLCTETWEAERLAKATGWNFGFMSCNVEPEKPRYFCKVSF